MSVLHGSIGAFTTAAQQMAMAGFEFIDAKTPISDQPIAELDRTAAEIAFIAPADLRAIADEIEEQARHVVRLAREYGERENELLLPRVAVALNHWSEAAKRFNARARRDLGTGD